MTHLKQLVLFKKSIELSIMKLLTTKISLVLIIILFNSSVMSQSLRIYHIDVEQVEATLFVSPGGNTLLIDSGKNGHGVRLRVLLTNLNISDIDHFVCTHYHEDHYGGINELYDASYIPIHHTYDRGDKSFLTQSKWGKYRRFSYQSGQHDLGIACRAIALIFLREVSTYNIKQYLHYMMCHSPLKFI